jgi:hypothetical protein
VLVVIAPNCAAESCPKARHRRLRFGPTMNPSPLATRSCDVVVRRLCGCLKLCSSSPKARTLRISMGSIPLWAGKLVALDLNPALFHADKGERAYSWIRSFDKHSQARDLP